jgi:hypothetical protein
MTPDADEVAARGSTPDAALAPDAPGVIAALPPTGAPQGEARLATRVGHRLLAIDPRARPYRVGVPAAYTACGRQYVAQIRICVTEAGKVSSVEILKPSIPVIDLQLPKVVGGWLYYPYLVDGLPTAFCYPLNYRVR